MAAVAEPLLITVEQYRQLPSHPDEVLELHWGEVVALSFPKIGHKRIQRRLVQLLHPSAEHLGIVDVEIAFRGLPEYEMRGADVAFVSQARWDATSDDDDLRGSPELVIEVLSPWNTRAEIRAKAALCLATGAEEFWVVDPKARTVSVTNRSGVACVYRSGDRIPIALLGSEIAVSDIFNS